MAWFSMAGYSFAADQINSARQVSYQPIRLPARGALTEVQSKSGLKRILALRVEFVVDTLATTTGDGTFDYGFDDTLYFDPPPHDSMFFADNLEFLRFYWDKMSAGDIDIKYDIYPPGAQASYQLPRQMWQYNYNQSDEQLDIGLAQLFYDAVIAADASGQITTWDDYDLIVIFHAGAGAEFDLGFTTTPHDLPSAWMTAVDLEVIDVFGGIPVNGGRPVQGGIILPETETHEGVQISMAGVVCSLFGHWLGLPALYDRDNGGVVVGKWSLMDRGFGNFFGAIPGQVDAWSRSYMGWIEPKIIEPSGLSDTFYIAALGFGIDTLVIDSLSIDSLLNDTLAQVYKIPLGAQESFIISCRNRDPEQDSVAIAYDREGRKMVFNEDYSVDADPGFRVPVWIDNLDFDAPGSGILIWHVDESMTELISEGRFNSVDGQRGLDLEEADGAQDIGEDYPFLTPGYGTDYGVFFDAWYSDNEFHKEANDGRQVSFNGKSYPDSRTNTGAMSHVVVNGFSRRNTVMSFEYSQAGLIFSSFFTENPYYGMAVGDFDEDSTDQEIVTLGDSITIFDGDGTIIKKWENFTTGQMYHTPPLIVDDQIVWATIDEDKLKINYTTKDGHEGMSSVYIHLNLAVDFVWLGSVVNDGIIAVYNYRDPSVDGSSPESSEIRLVLLGDSNQKIGDGRLLSVHRLGDESSSNILTISHSGIVQIVSFEAIESVSTSKRIRGNNSEILISTFDDADEISFLETRILGDLRDYDIGNVSGVKPLLADFDGSGYQDILLIRSNANGNHYTVLIRDIELNGLDDIEMFDNDMSTPIPPYPLDFGTERRFLDFSRAIPIDVDNDGGYEFLGYSGDELIAYEYNGTIAAGYPIPIPSGNNSSTKTKFPLATLQVADLRGSDNWEFLFEEGIKSDSSESRYSQIYSMDDAGRTISGFPMNALGEAGSVRLAQLDDEPDLEMVIATDGAIYAYDPNFKGELSDIWWGQPLRDNLHSNAVWEAAEPFEPSASAGLLIDSECYNWPNPASGSTTIRYALNFAAEVTVDIYDITGERILTLHDSGLPGLPNEIQWDLSNIPRGGYIAMLKASSNGQSDSKKIKIAVLR